MMGRAWTLIQQRALDAIIHIAGRDGDDVAIQKKKRPAPPRPRVQ
jgi:hypothetical protein